MSNPSRGSPTFAIASLAGSSFSLLIAASPTLAQPFGFDPVFELSSLLPANGGDGSLGFVLNGIDIDDFSGYCVAPAGDVNGDGIDDLLVYAIGADPVGGDSLDGETYVVFGRNDAFPSSIELSSLDGTDGFRLDGLDGNRLGPSPAAVARAGDVNGDGIDDIVLGERHGSPGGRVFAGSAYIVFGRSTPFPSSIALSSLDGTTGFRVNGVDGGDFCGAAVASAGDVNADGFSDIVMSATGYSPPGRSLGGAAFVVLGRSTPLPASIELSSLLPENGGTGAGGFILIGADPVDSAGHSVASAGDVNSDGIDDVFVSAHQADPGGRSVAGEAYVIFGRSTPFPAAIDLRVLSPSNGGDGSLGFILNGIDAGDQCGSFVAPAGDVNGDGIDDALVSAVTATPYGRAGAGESYVVFGRSTPFPASIELSSLLPANGGNGSLGFILNGIDGGDASGTTVSSAGDVNGDDVADLIIGAPSADPSGRASAGESYVVFGRSTPFPASIELSSLLPANGGDGSLGFILNGIDAPDASGRSVASAGDVNADGFDDFIVSGHRGDPGGRSNAGESYVLFGRPSCRADYNNDGTLDAFDYDDFVSAYFEYVNSGTGFPDYNNDGYVDAFDYDDFVSDFFTGCA